MRKLGIGLGVFLIIFAVFFLVWLILYSFVRQQFDDTSLIDIADDEVANLDITNEIFDLQNNNDGTFTVTYLYTVTNQYPAVVSDIFARSNVAQSFAPYNFDFISLTSPTLSINQNFNGSTDIELLTGVDSMDPGEVATMLLTVILYPEGSRGPFRNEVEIEGRLDSGQGEHIPAPPVTPTPPPPTTPMTPPPTPPVFPPISSPIIFPTPPQIPPMPAPPPDEEEEPDEDETGGYDDVEFILDYGTGGASNQPVVTPIILADTAGLEPKYEILLGIGSILLVLALNRKPIYKILRGN